MINLLWVGRDAERKGLGIFLSLVSELSRENYAVFGHVVGLSKSRKSFNLSQDNVQWHGNLSSSEVYYLMDRSDVLVLPSLVEGFASVIIEAMYHECIILATHSSGAVIPGELESVILTERSLDCFMACARNLLSLNTQQIESLKNHNSRFAQSYFSHSSWQERLIQCILFSDDIQ
jgi:glycosyltransferase involved in cell wall biosynthesis